MAITVLPSDTLMGCLKEHANDLGRARIRETVERIKAERVVNSEPTPKPQIKRRTPVKKPGAGIRATPDPAAISPDHPDLPYYAQVENVVAKCPGLSLGATAIYTFIAAHCIGDRTYWRIGHQEFKDRFGVSKTTLLKYIRELAQWGFIKVKRRGHMQWNEYRLVAKQKRIERSA